MQNNHNQNKGSYNVTIIYDTLEKAEKSVENVEKLSPQDTEEEKTLLPLWQQAVLCGMVLFLLGFGGAFHWLTGEEDTVSDDTPEGIVEKPQDPFQEIFIEAKAALVFDVTKNKIMYGKNAEAQLPLASLAKLMTALIAEETLLSDEAVVLGKEAINEEGDNGLLVGEEWQKDDLIKLMLLASSNDGAHALARAVEAFRAEGSSTDGATPQFVPFSEMMNIRTQELGLTQTYFLNAAGLDVHKQESGAYGSARDIAILLSYILKNAPQILDATQYNEQIFTSLGGVTHILKNTNERVSRIGGIVASKTGFTDLAGGNLAIIFEAGPMYPVAIVVLGSTPEGRFTDAEALISATLQKLNQE